MPETGNTSSQQASSTTVDAASLPFMVDGLETFLLGTQSQRTTTKVTAAYAAVRKAVVTHELSATYPLEESWLRTRFDVGRTPLREALKRLTHEKFLIWPSHQSPVIRDVGVEELPRLFETRVLLETQIASVAAHRATPADIERLYRILGFLSDASTTGHIYHSVELDFAFHAALAQATQNRFLREASDSLNRQSLRLWYRSQSALGIGIVGILHHKLADTIRNRDAVSAGTLAREHIERSVDRQQQLQRLQISEIEHIV